VVNEACFDGPVHCTKATSGLMTLVLNTFPWRSTMSRMASKITIRTLRRPQTWPIIPLFKLIKLAVLLYLPLNAAAEADKVADFDATVAACVATERYSSNSQ